MEILLAIIGVGALLVISSIWRGFVLSILWKWFAVPIFGLPALSIPAAIGVSLIIGFLVYQHQYTNDDRSEGQKLASGAVMIFFYPALVLLIGWVVTLFL